MQNLIPARSTTSQAGSVMVTSDSARRSSVVWGAIRLRADSVSTMPCRVKRQMPDGSIQRVDDQPRYRIDGIGGNVDFEEWLYSSQQDLDLTGNTIGVIEQRDPDTQRPTWIRLLDSSKVTIFKRGPGPVKYRIGGDTLDASEVWHERQFTIGGSPVGLSPLHFAAWSLGQNLSALQFGLQYFQTPGLPTAHIKNSRRQLTEEQALVARRRYEATMTNGRGVFVSGNDWELDIKTLRADESQFLATMGASDIDLCRFFGVPPEMIGVPMPSGSVTYANVTQRFLDFLVLHLSPALVRRERRFSRALLPNMVYAEFDPSSLLRLDPAAQAAVNAGLVAARIRTPSEIRTDEYGLPALTPEQVQEFIDLGIVGVPATPVVPKVPDKPSM